MAPLQPSRLGWYLGTAPPTHPVYHRGLVVLFQNISQLCPLLSTATILVHITITPWLDYCKILWPGLSVSTLILPLTHSFHSNQKDLFGPQMSSYPIFSLYFVQNNSISKWPLRSFVIWSASLSRSFLGVLSPPSNLCGLFWSSNTPNSLLPSAWQLSLHYIGWLTPGSTWSIRKASHSLSLM